MQTKKKNLKKILTHKTKTTTTTKTTMNVFFRKFLNYDIHLITCVESGNAPRFSEKGRERAIVNQTNIGTVSKAS